MCERDKFKKLAQRTSLSNSGVQCKMPFVLGYEQSTCDRIKQQVRVSGITGTFYTFSQVKTYSNSLLAYNLIVPLPFPVGNKKQYSDQKSQPSAVKKKNVPQTRGTIIFLDMFVKQCIWGSSEKCLVGTVTSIQRKMPILGNRPKKKSKQWSQHWKRGCMERRATQLMEKSSC